MMVHWTDSYCTDAYISRGWFWRPRIVAVYIQHGVWWQRDPPSARAAVLCDQKLSTKLDKARFKALQRKFK